MSQTMRPFSNGTECMVWAAYNCDRCTKQAAPEVSLDDMPCDIERALSWAMFYDGRIPLAIAERGGLVAGGPCPERQAGKPAWVNKGARHGD